MPLASNRLIFSHFCIIGNSRSSFFSDRPCDFLSLSVRAENERILCASLKYDVAGSGQFGATWPRPSLSTEFLEAEYDRVYVQIVITLCLDRWWDWTRDIIWIVVDLLTVARVMILQLRNEGLVFRGQVSLCGNARAASGAALLIFAEVVSMRERKTEADSANCCFLGLFMCPEGLSDRFSTRLKQVGGMR